MFVLLVVTRVPKLGVKSLLIGDSVTIRVEKILGTGIGAKSQPLCLPGTIFIVFSLVTFVLYGTCRESCRKAWSQSGKTTL